MTVDDRGPGSGLRGPEGQAAAQHRSRAVGLYVHVPFCVSRCAYCAFVTSTELHLIPRVMAAVRREVEALGRRGGRPLATLYLGGGTPSLLPAEVLAGLFAVLDRRFPRLPGAEVTLEANPDDVTEARARAWAELGVTRVSVGTQTFSDRGLALLGRRHTAAQASSAVRTLQGAGFEVSVDLMLGLPGLGTAELDATLEELLRLRPGHVSVYLLETDKAHALARLAERRPDLFPDGDAAASQYLAVGRRLVAAGYRHYEISNFALPSRQARHNLRYWLRLPVLAAGVAAHGHAGRRRWANVDELSAYLDAVENGRAPRAWSRRLTAPEEVKERVMLGLRLARGVSAATIAACSALVPAFAAGLEDFLSLDLARRVRTRVRLTPRGWLLSNELLNRLW